MAPLPPKECPSNESESPSEPSISKTLWNTLSTIISGKLDSEIYREYHGQGLQTVTGAAQGDEHGGMHRGCVSVCQAWNCQYNSINFSISKSSFLMCH